MRVVIRVLYSRGDTVTNGVLLAPSTHPAAMRGCLLRQYVLLGSGSLRHLAGLREKWDRFPFSLGLCGLVCVTCIQLRSEVRPTETCSRRSAVDSVLNVWFPAPRPRPQSSDFGTQANPDFRGPSEVF